MSIRFSLLTSTKPKIVTKRFDRLADGSLKKTTFAHVTRGHVDPVTVKNLKAFGHYLEGLQTNTALMYGVPLSWRASEIVVQSMLDSQPEMNAISRTNRHFQYAQAPGILMLDYDPPIDGDGLSKPELVKRLLDAVPELAATSLLWFPSASSHICVPYGEDLTGLRGQRLYVALTDASDIPRLGEQIVLRLWAAGEGRYEISKSGALLKRTLVDASVWQPSRLDFAAGASLGDGLEQRRGVPELIPAEGCDPDAECSFFDSKALLPDAEPEISNRAEAAMRRAEEDIRPRSSARRRAFVRERIEENGANEQNSVREETEETIIRAIEDAILDQDFVLHLHDPNSVDSLARVTVATVLSDVDRYDQRAACDPIEPDYNDWSRTAKLFLRGKQPNVHSLAHGGRNYKLNATRPMIIVKLGGMSTAVEQTLTAMQASRKFMNLGDAVVTVRGYRPTLLNADSMNYRLGQFVSYKKIKTVKGEEFLEDIDPPEKLGRQILNIGKSERPLPDLLGIVRGPFFRPSGTICDRPGFDAESGIYGDFIGADFPAIPDVPTSAECKVAHDLIWSPFRELELDSAASKTGLLCAILTAPIRAALDKSPIFASLAPDHGSGKTLVNEALGMLAIGKRPAIMPPLDGTGEDEMRKRLTASLLPPAEPVLLIDNIEGFIGSTVLASFITASSWSDRILGHSRIESELPNRALVLLSGKNLQFKEELARRTLCWTIAASASGPYSRTFSFCPVELMSKRRPEIIVAVLTLFRAAQLAGPVSTQQVPSFPQWDRFVRQTVLWLNRTVATDVYEDPLDLLRHATEQSDDRSEAYELLNVLYDWQDGETFFAHNLATAASLTRVDLKVLLEGLTGRRGTAFSARSVGRYLKGLSNRPFHDLILRSNMNQNMREWYVERVALSENPEKSDSDGQTGRIVGE
jgi:hypothetical protein